MKINVNQTMATSPSALKCSSCYLRKLCLPDSVDPEGLKQLEAAIEASSPYTDHQIVCEAEQSFDKIYAVKSGMFKTVTMDTDGHEHIVEFHLPGELIGLDAIHPGKYLSTAISIGNSSLCEIHYNDLESLASRLPLIQHQLLSLMSKQVHVSNEWSKDQTAEQKLATFLLSLSSRYKQRDYSDSRINLIMPRRDIANYLNLASETVSRLFKRFQRDNILTIKRSDLVISDMRALKRLAGCTAEC